MTTSDLFIPAFGGPPASFQKRGLHILSFDLIVMCFTHIQHAFENHSANVAKKRLPFCWNHGPQKKQFLWAFSAKQHVSWCLNDWWLTTSRPPAPAQAKDLKFQGRSNCHRARRYRCCSLDFFSILFCSRSDVSELLESINKVAIQKAWWNMKCNLTYDLKCSWTLHWWYWMCEGYRDAWQLVSLSKLLFLTTVLKQLKDK